MARRRGSGSYTNRGDGVPAQKYSGLDYSKNKAVNDQMAAAPTRPQQGGGGPGGMQPGPSQGPDGIFGPTDRPDEPLTAGVDAGAGPGAPMVPAFEPDQNIGIRAIVAEVAQNRPELAEYIIGLADA